MMQEQMFTQRVKNRHCLSVASLAVFQLNLLVISEWSVWVVLWNFLHKKFPPSAQDKKTILPPLAVPLPLQGRLNVSLTGQHPPKSSLTREENNFLDTVYSLFTTHYSLIHNDTDFSRFTFLFSLNAAFDGQCLKTFLISGQHNASAPAPNTTRTDVGVFLFSILSAFFIPT